MIGMIFFPLVLAAVSAHSGAVPAPAAVSSASSLPADLDPNTPSPEWVAKMVRPCVRSAARATC